MQQINPSSCERRRARSLPQASGRPIFGARVDGLRLRDLGLSPFPGALDAQRARRRRQRADPDAGQVFLTRRPIRAARDY